MPGVNLAYTILPLARNAHLPGDGDRLEGHQLPHPIHV